MNAADMDVKAVFTALGLVAAKIRPEAPYRDNMQKIYDLAAEVQRICRPTICVTMDDHIRYHNVLTEIVTKPGPGLNQATPVGDIWKYAELTTVWMSQNFPGDKP